MMPINEGENFNQIADVLKKKTLDFSVDGSGNYSEKDCDENLKDSIESSYQ